MFQKVMARRGFLRVMGAAAAAPVAAELHQKQAVAAGINPSVLSDPADCIEDGIGTVSPDDLLRDKLWREMRKKGLPQWKKDQLWEDAKSVRSLDADLAVNRSFSLVAKVHMQQCRNYESHLKMGDRQYTFSKERQKWLDRWGLRWF